jgi:hypothetical protein
MPHTCGTPPRDDHVSPSHVGPKSSWPGQPGPPPSPTQGASELGHAPIPTAWLRTHSRAVVTLRTRPLRAITEEIHIRKTTAIGYQIDSCLT